MDNEQKAEALSAITAQKMMDTMMEQFTPVWDEEFFKEFYTHTCTAILSSLILSITYGWAKSVSQTEKEQEEALQYMLNMSYALAKKKHENFVKSKEEEIH